MNIEKYETINEIVKRIEKTYQVLTKYEAISLAIQEQRNQILAAGFSRIEEYLSAGKHK